ncbi:MAG: 50S ribosomal protein L15 [Fimbriiglobus sp.]
MDLSSVSTGVQKRKLKKRVGRGIGSGHGKTASRGHKGQYSSAGANLPGALFTGGQTPIHRRFPKRGFTNGTFKKDYAIVNIGDLEVFDNGATVNMETLQEKRLVVGTYDGVRILGEGELTKKLTITADHFTASAKTKIEAKGGTTTVIPKPKKPVRNKMGTRAKALAAKGPKPTAAK